MNKKTKFTDLENKVLHELAQSLFVWRNGDYETEKLLFETKSRTNSLVRLGLIVPVTESKYRHSWFKLTDIGILFFKGEDKHMTPEKWLSYYKVVKQHTYNFERFVKIKNELKISQ